MPVSFLRQLSGTSRTSRANKQLGGVLCFVAGAMNAGGFLALQQYTSHMTGIVSHLADQIALGDLALTLSGIGALMAFLAGAASSAVLINWARRRKLHSQFAAPLMVEAVLLLCCGVLGILHPPTSPLFVPLAVALLCFIMGLQNAIVTKISHAEIRTTHVTGLVTDIGIELGKLIYCNRKRYGPAEPLVAADRVRLRLLVTLLGLFFLGGIAGGLGFRLFGYLATFPLVALLAIVAAVPVADDVRPRLRR